MKKRKKNSNTLFIAGGAVALLFVGCCVCSGVGWVFRSSIGLGEGVAKLADAGKDKTAPTANLDGKSPPTGAKDGKTPSSGGKDGAKDGNKGGGAEAIAVNAESLAKEIQTNPAGANAKYKNKTLAITGNVEYVIAKDMFLLKGARLGPENRVVVFHCNVAPEAENMVVRFGVNQKVKVVCNIAVLEIRDDLILLGQCTVTELEPSKLSVLPVQAVITEYRNNYKAAIAKYAATGLIVSGTIKKVKTFDGFDKVKRVETITLQAGDNEIVISTSGLSQAQVNLAAGERIEIRCDAQPVSLGPSSFFGGGILIRKLK